MIISSKHIVLGLLILGAAHANAAFTLDSNDASLTYTFSNLVSTTEDTGSSSISGTPYDAKVSISAGGYGSYEVLWYDDHNSIIPFNTATHSYGTAWNARFGSVMSNWITDLEGKIELRWLSGSRPIFHIKIIIRDSSGNYYAQTLDIPDALLMNTSNGTPYIWLYNLGYRDNYEAYDIVDLDHDGFLNWQEYAADTNPNNATDYLKARISDGSINIDSSISCRYGIMYCDDLHTGHWDSLTNNINGNGAIMSITPSHSNPSRYFKVTAERKP